jgi:hypothetical protein
MSEIFCFAANGPIWGKFRSENAHLALLNSAFRASFTPNRPHFRLKQKYSDMLSISQPLTYMTSFTALITRLGFGIYASTSVEA